MSDLVCDMCGKTGPDVKRKRQNTAYVDDEANFNSLCPPCQEEADAYWAEMWAEYYRGCL